MRRGKRTLAIVVITTTLMSCSSQKLPATTPTVPAAPQVYATTAVTPLLEDLTLAYLDTQPPPLEQANYRTRLNQLYQGEIDYVMTNHLAVDTPLWAAPIAQDGIALITHQDVGVRDISLQQLRDIYQGRITSWAELGGTDTKIHVFSREDGSGTRAEFEQMVMGYRSVTRNARLAASSSQMVESVSREPGSIGYVSVSYVDDSVQTLTINGVAPTLKNIVDQIYPLRMIIYIVGLAEPVAAERAFIGWIQSPAAQQIIGSRYAPLGLALSGTS